ncbi:MAG TPA: transcription termination factor NusA [Micropepsaceae bacterium]|nr:transcription termination factor NusA [Micropepsaceae bacterium]
MAIGVAANRLELLQIADAVAREKSIDKSVVIHAMEEAMQRAAKSRYGTENEIKVEIDPKTGETHISRYLHVVDQIDNDKIEISIADARRRNPAAQVGDIIAETLPPIEFSRIATQAAKQVIVQKVRDAERERQYDEYKDRIGEIVHGTVKRVEFGSVVVDFGRAEGVVRRDEMIPRESFRNGDRIRAYIYDVRRETRGPQIFLSRTHPQFMARLFAQEVPEIYDGIIEIRAVARDPGSRAKIAVISKDSSIDPVGACVGMRGVRVQAVVQELQGERIDIIPWNGDPATFIVNALAPAEVSKVVLDEETRRVEVVVPDDQLSLAIGRRGQNVRLASQLTGWQIDILTEQEESERRQKEFAERTALFMEALDVDETIAQLLASEGFASVEDVAFVPVHELAEIEGFDEDTAEELQARAVGYIEQKNAAFDAKRRELGVTDDVAEIEGLTPAMLVKLGENDIKTLEDFAGCASDDLLGYVENKGNERVRVPGALDGFDLVADEVNDLIMKARVKAGWVKAEDLVKPEAEPAEEAPEA